MKTTHRNNQTASGTSGREFTQKALPTHVRWALERKHLLIGTALSGAKFTPGHHRNTGDEIGDAILRGDYIATDPSDLAAEIEQLHAMGVRYFHWHARNPATREQSCDDGLYRRVGRLLRHRNREVVLGFGGSRNGREIAESIRRRGEWSRLSQAAIPRQHGGADFVTIQAAAELVIVLDLERQGFIRLHREDAGFDILEPMDAYLASAVAEDLSIGAHSTAGGADYGRSSAWEQMRTLSRAIAARGHLGLPQEVEWTQLQRSHALTRLALEHFNPGLGNTGRLNVTILFGFSPKLPFPLTYGEFRDAVALARSLRESAPSFPALDLTVTVGAAVLPRQAHELSVPLDVGRDRGTVVGPLERLIAYACQPDSDVDMLRFGLEDTPYHWDANGGVNPATNTSLGEDVFERIDHHGGVVVTDPVRLRHFVSTEIRTGCGRAA